MSAPKILAEVCLETGWNIEYVLCMPAIRFFAFKKAMSEYISEKSSRFIYEMIPALRTAGADSEYTEKVQSYYKSQFMNLEKTSNHKRNADFDIGKPDDQKYLFDYFSSIAKYFRAG